MIARCATCRGACRWRVREDDCRPGGPFCFASVRRSDAPERLQWTLPVHLGLTEVAALRVTVQGDDVVASLDLWEVV
jgi:hypothetical protein